MTNKLSPYHGPHTPSPVYTSLHFLHATSRGLILAITQLYQTLTPPHPLSHNSLNYYAASAVLAEWELPRLFIQRSWARTPTNFISIWENVCVYEFLVRNSWF